MLNLNRKEINMLVNTVNRSTESKKYRKQGEFVVFQSDQMRVQKYVISAGYHNYTNECYELLYVYSGKNTLLIDDRKINLEENTIFLFKPKNEYTLKLIGEHSATFRFSFKYSYFETLSSMLEIQSPYTDLLFDTNEYLMYEWKNQAYLKEYMDLINDCIIDENPSMKVKLFISHVFLKLITYDKYKISFNHESYKENDLKFIREYIITNYQNGSLKGLSECMKTSKYRLCKLIKKETGFTFVELLQKEKLRHAAALLEESDLSNEEIMKKIGYENPTYFYRIFKEIYGVTPNTYRNSSISN